MAARCVSVLFGAMIPPFREILSAGIGFAFVAASGGLHAAAQQFVADGGAVARGPLPGFEAPGISSGEYLLRSTVSIGAAYDSNILRTQSNVLPDAIFFVSPTFDLTRDGGKHIEEIFARVTSAAYARSDADNVTNAYIRASESYLLSPGSQVLVNASFADGYERRASSNYEIPFNAAEPVHQQSLLGSVGYTKSWGHWDTGVALSATHQTFDDVKSTSGAILDQTYRNEDDLALRTFLNLQISPRIQSNVTFSATAARIRDRARDSDQWTLSDTSTVTLTSKTSAGFRVSVSEQDYYNNPLIPVRPLYAYEAFIEWSPIQRLTFTVRGGYQDLGVDYVKGLPGGGFGQSGSLDVQYLIRRNIQLSSTLSYDKYFFSGGNGIRDTLTERAALTYEVSAYAGLSFLYLFQKTTASTVPSSVQTMPYDEQVFQTSLNLRF
jgi:hypothetical protein